MLKSCAYNRDYLPRARAAMGTMLDYAVWDVKMDIDEYFTLFVTSGLADRFGNGEPSVVAGMSGVEIAREALTRRDMPRKCRGRVSISTEAGNTGRAGRLPISSGRVRFRSG